MAEDISVIVKAVDQASTTLGHIQKSVHNLDQSFGSLKGRLATGFGVGAGVAAFHLLEDGIRRLVDLLPDLISKGAEWGEAVHTIAIRTGMTAEQSSLLAGVANRVGVSTDSLTLGLTRMAKSLATNEKQWASLGIATRDTNGKLVDAYTLFQNVRRAVSAHGAGLLSTAAAQQLFSRGGADLLQVLQLNDEQFRILGLDVGRLGLVMNGQGVEAARNFQLTLERFNQTVQGVGVSIFGALGPTLTGFVEAFSNFINANLDKIVKFAVQVANFVMGVISGLFGFDFAAISVAQSVNDAGTAAKGAATNFGALGNPSTGKIPQATKATDALTEALKRQIAVIDRQIQAIQDRENARHARDDRNGLRQAILDASDELKRLQNERIYTGGMSNAEAVLARQKHVQDLIDARKKVSDAEKTLATHDADAADQARIDQLQKKRQALQDEMAAHQAAMSKMAATSAASMASSAKAIRMSFGGIGSSIGTSLTSGIKDFGTTFATEAASALQTGKDFANTLKDFLLGPEGTPIIDTSGGTFTINYPRSGGLFDKIGSLVSTLVELSGHIADLVNLIGSGGKAAGDVAGEVKDVLAGLFGSGQTQEDATVKVLKPFVEAGLVIMGPGGVIDQFLHGAPSSAGGAGMPGGSMPSGNPGALLNIVLKGMNDPDSQISQIVNQLRFVRRNSESGGDLWTQTKEVADTTSFLPSMLSTLQGIVGSGLGTAGDLYRKLAAGITTAITGTVGVTGAVNANVTNPGIKVEAGANPLNIGPVKVESGSVKVESGSIKVEKGASTLLASGSFGIIGTILGLTNPVTVASGSVKVEKGASTLLTGVSGPINAIKTGAWNIDSIATNVGVTNPGLGALVNGTIDVQSGPGTTVSIGTASGRTVKVESGTGTSLVVAPKGGSLPIESASGSTVSIATASGKTVKVESGPGSSVQVNNPSLPNLGHLPGIKTEVGQTSTHTENYASWPLGRYLWQIAYNTGSRPGAMPGAASTPGGFPASDAGLTVNVFLDGQQVNSVIQRIQRFRDAGAPNTARPTMAGAGA